MKIVQQDIDTISIQLVIDEQLKDTPPTLDDISHVFYDGFRKKFGDSVVVSIQEVKEVTRDEPRITSNVDPDQLSIKGYR
jgi:hypothetical protein